MKMIVALSAFLAVLGSSAPDVAAKRRPPPPAFDATGWTLLATHAIDGTRELDTISVRADVGRLDELTFVVEDADLELRSVTVVFANGDRATSALAHRFRDGARSRALELPGVDRRVVKVEVAYGKDVRGTLRIYGRDRTARPAAFDPAGWTLIAAQTVERARARQTVEVGKYLGRYDELAMVVSDSELELTGAVIVFGNGDRWSPAVRHLFKNGQRSLTFELPNGDRFIKAIELAYGDAPNGGYARMQVYGREHGPAAQPAPPPPPRFDATGWTFLGTQTVDGRRDRDTIRVGRYRGSFDQLTIVVTESDLEMRDMTIVFANGKRWSPRLTHVFRENTRTRAIDLPGKDRKIARIELAYGNLPGGGKARVEVYGRDLARPPPPARTVRWESNGWTRIGRAIVDGWRDQDRVTVRSAAAFTDLMLVATGSDIAIYDVVVTFGDRETFTPKIRAVFDEGTRTRPIDLPGGARRIRTIDFSYSDLPGGGLATVEIWARNAAGRR